VRKLACLVALATLPVTAASAADMALKAPPAAASPFSWTGFYLGGEAGWGVGSEQITHTTASGAFPLGFVQAPIDYDGLIGGFYGGYNYQVGQWLAGVDGDVSLSGIAGMGTDISPVNRDISNPHSNIDWLATATGRLGYANNNWLLFAKGGWAWAGFSGTSELNTPAGVPVNTSRASEARNGWTVGAGLEYACSAHWSIKLEYDYVGFITANYILTTTSAAGVVTLESRSATSALNVVKSGVAYRF